MTTIAAAALAYLSCGLSVIPIATDGSKSPLVAWAPFQTAIMTEDEAARLFPPGVGLAVIGGAVSGGLEVLDFDHPDAYPRWLELLEQTDPELCAIVQGLPLVATPDEGRHLYYRCSEVERNTKLATAAEPFRGPRSGKLKTTLIETRGERGYVLAPPSPAACHEVGELYEHVGGVEPANVPTITPEERETLLATARLLDEVPAEPERQAPPQRDPGPNTGERPGDDWAARSSWDDVLTPHGWVRAGQTGGQDAWRRPGKTRGISATCNGEHLYVHTTNATPLEAGRAYDKLGLLAALDHQGDIGTAVRALAAGGYGEQRQPRQPTTAELDPFDEADPFDDPDFYRDPAEDQSATADGPTPDRGLTLAEIGAPLPPLEYLLEEYGLVSGGGAPHMIAGFGGSGKTMACQSLLLGLACGRPVWDHYRHDKTYRVAHVDFEQGERLCNYRYQRLARGMRVHLPSHGDELTLYSFPPDLRLTPACRTRWERIMAGRDLVLVDSLRAATAGVDENSSAIREHLDFLGQLAEATGCRGLILHHARKLAPDQTTFNIYSIRGSSAIVDGSDAILIFSGQHGEPVHVKQPRARSRGLVGPESALVIEDVPAEADSEDQTPGLRVSVRGAELVEETRAKLAEQDRAKRALGDAKRIREALLGHVEGLNSRDLRDATGLSGQRYHAAMRVLNGTVTRTKGACNAVIHRLA